MSKKSQIASLINDLANILLQMQLQIIEDMNNYRSDILKASDAIDLYQSLTYYKASISIINTNLYAIDIVTQYLSALITHLQTMSYHDARNKLEDLRYRAGEFAIQSCDSFEKLEQVWGESSRIRVNNALIDVEAQKFSATFIEQYRRDL